MDFLPGSAGFTDIRTYPATVTPGHVPANELSEDGNATAIGVLHSHSSEPDGVVVLRRDITRDRFAVEARVT